MLGVLRKPPEKIFIVKIVSCQARWVQLKYGSQQQIKSSDHGGMDGRSPPPVRKEDVNGDVYSFDGDDRKGAG